MRYEKGHKEASRQRIIDTASARFRKDGIEAVGLAELMAEAGLTHGAFYSHFSSKEDLVRAVMERTTARFVERFESQVKDGGLESWIRFYLRTGHRDHPEGGCAAAALAAELARHPEMSRQAFTENLARVTDSIAKYLPADLTFDEKRKTARSIFSLLVGAIQMARAVNDPTLSDEMLEAGIASALSLARIKTNQS